MLDLVYFVQMISEYYKFSTVKIFHDSHRETSQAPAPVTLQNPYDVFRGQNRYATPPLDLMTLNYRAEC